MALTITIVAIALFASAGVLVVFMSMQPTGPTNADVVDKRLGAFEGTQPMSPEEIELQKPLLERLVLPALRSVAQVVANSTPERQILETQRKLMLAGRPGGMSAVDFLSLRYIAAVVLGLLGLVAGLVAGSTLMAALAMGGGAILGLLLPGLWLSRRVKSRREEIALALPDALDLLIVSVEAGLTFEAAMGRVSEKFRNALGQEFGRVLQETRLGRRFSEALEDMGERCGVEELQQFVQAVIQSQQFGAGVARILKVQADEIRRKRMQRAQVKGAQASIKMLLPMIGCIFPTIWIVILGPGLLMVLHVLGGRK